jgi:Zn-dependent protease with chaperone function
MPDAPVTIETYHTHLLYTLSVTLCSWLAISWYGRRHLHDRPGQRVSLYGLAIVLPLYGEAVSYLIEWLRPSVDTLSGHAITQLHVAVIQWLPIDDLLDLALAPAISEGLLVLLIGLAVFSLLRQSLATRRFHRLLDNARPLATTEHAPIETAFRQIVRCPSRELPLVLVADLDAPLACTTGLLRPRIYVTRRLLELLSPDEVAAVLCHEWAHVVRRDLPRNALLALLRDMLCFLPGSVLFWRSMIVSQDEACDALAARLTRQPLVLARALVKVARCWANTPPIALPAASLFTPAHANPRARVEQMLRISTATPAASGIGPAVLTLVVLLLSTLPVLLGC